MYLSITLTKIKISLKILFVTYTHKKQTNKHRVSVLKANDNNNLFEKIDKMTIALNTH